MAINEYQLSTWSQQGSTTASANTYNSIKTCIEGNNWNNDVSFNIYLQGSYKNSTNIRGDSDVDVVIEFSSIFHSNKQKLSSDQLAAFNEYYSDGKYSLASFRNAVIDRLKNYYGEQYIEVGNKSIKVLANSGRLDCDVICCAEYREYNSFSKLAPNDYVKGIIFWTNNTNQEIINFPQLHYDNGVTKNQICSSNFKSSVRVIKNMRTRLVQKNYINEALAPSYFVECLMYNLHNSNYLYFTFVSRIQAVINALISYSDSDLERLVCQNRQRYLFGTTDQQWNINDCKIFISRLNQLWYEG